MVARNKLLSAPPHSVENALKTLGSHLRTARTRRQFTREEIAKKIGTGIRAIADAENGKPSTSMAVYAALLWTYGLLKDLESLAAPHRDHEGETLALLREPKRSQRGGGLDNDF